VVKAKNTEKESESERGSGVSAGSLEKTLAQGRCRRKVGPRCTLAAAGRSLALQRHSLTVNCVCTFATATAEKYIVL